MFTFWHIVSAILKEVSASETISWCWSISYKTSIFRYSKNYGSLTHETRIKDAVNMEDLICLLATVRTLKWDLLYMDWWNCDLQMMCANMLCYTWYFNFVIPVFCVENLLCLNFILQTQHVNTYDSTPRVLLNDWHSHVLFGYFKINYRLLLWTRIMCFLFIAQIH